MLFERLKKLKKYDPEAEQKLRQEIQEAGGLEKNDLKAMIIAAMLVILPVILVILGLFGLVIWLFL